jgi:HD-GYP domain-containing protein (c-di-GMP phosphodiesterase class II)
MKLYINDILYAFSYALDCVEYELVGIASQHGKRVAYICLVLGESLGLDKLRLNDLAACALLHDNALTEYIHEEIINGVDVVKEKNKINAGLHCVLGEDNIKSFPFNSDVSGAVLYHHENSDGSGPFGKKWFETHIYAQLIHLADSVDVQFNLSEITEEKYDKVLKYLNNQKNIKYHESLVELFEKTIDYECLVKAQDLYIKSSLEEKQPVIYMDYSLEQIVSFVDVIANIIDYKSEFTMKHSMGIAKKAATMAKYYEYDEETIVKLYFAGAVHDIGKLVIDKDVLEKPDKLTDSEFIYMKNHAYYTYEILKDIRGFEDITSWASMHHEKLNGAGYPFGKTAEDLSFNERLMGCLDIYQALTETRPYKQGFTHEKTIKIMRDMSKNNFIDDSIVSDINKVFIPS